MKTLNGNNGSFANTGGISLQPLPASSLNVQASKQTSVTPNNLSTGVLPIRQALLPISTIFSGPSTKLTKITTLSDIAASVSTNGLKFVIPLSSEFNHIMPTYALNLDAGSSYDPRLTQGYVTTTTKFKPYESLTGISQERPEIIMLTNFEPLFMDGSSSPIPSYLLASLNGGTNPNMTLAGNYINAQIQMRNIRSFGVQQKIVTFKNGSVVISSAINAQQSAFTQSVSNLKGISNFLLNLAATIETSKSQLDLRNDIYTVDPSNLASYIANNFTQLQVPAGTNLTQLLAAAGHRSAWTCVDVLHDLGYTTSAVNGNFSSTKIWMQLLAELKDILKFHSSKFLSLPTTYASMDKSPTNIMLSPLPHFSLNKNLPSLPPLIELTSLQVQSAPQAINALQPAFGTLYQTTHFVNEESRIVALANLLTKEYKYSYGLTQQQVQNALQNFYGFTVAPTGNSTMFDSIIGSFGNNITDFPLVGQQSLVSVAQVRQEQVGILPFETKYITGDTGTLTPGGDYYFDSLFQTTTSKLDSTSIDSFSSFLDTQQNQLAIMVDGLNLLSLPVYPNQNKNGQTKANAANYLADATSTVSQLSGQLISLLNGQTLPAVVNDRLAAVYSFARDNVNIKTLLFLYTISKISRNYTQNVPGFTSSQQADNTPLVDYLINQVASTLESNIPQSRLSNQTVANQGLGNVVQTDSFTSNSVIAAMKSGSTVTKIVEQFMSNVVTQFLVNSQAIQGGYTKFNGYIDTTVMMVAFDLVIAMIAKYSNQQITGVHNGVAQFSQGLVTYVVAQNSTNHDSSFLEMLQKCSQESQIAQEIIMTLINVMRSLSGSMKGLSNYLNSANTVSNVSEIAAILQNDPNLVRLLFNEQQIKMIASTVDAIIAAQNDYTNNKSTDPETELILLDESDIPSALHDALMGYFSAPQLSSPSAVNNKILTVGVPAGFTQAIKQTVNVQNNASTSFKGGQSDFVYVTVYKVDTVNSDIVFKPQRFLFQMSRFPTRYTTSKWLTLPQSPSQIDVVNSIPTQCYDGDISNGVTPSISTGVEYAQLRAAGSSGSGLNTLLRLALSNDIYDFLTDDQKSEVLQNHIASQLLEAYVKLMTGVNVAEYNYDLIDIPAQLVDSGLTQSMLLNSLKQITGIVSTQKTNNNSTPAGGVLFNTTAINKTFSNVAGVAGKVIPSMQFLGAQQANAAVATAEKQANVGSTSSLLDTLNSQHVTIVSQAMKVISSFSNTLSSLSSSDAMSKKVIAPKQFERVFNILIDPSAFQIDVEKTTATPYGTQAMALMIAAGDIVSVQPDYLPVTQANGNSSTHNNRTYTQSQPNQNVNAYVLRERDKTQGDLIADKYIVTIETFDEGQS